MNIGNEDFSFYFCRYKMELNKIKQNFPVFFFAREKGGNIYEIIQHFYSIL